MKWLLLCLLSVLLLGPPAAGQEPNARDFSLHPQQSLEAARARQRLQQQSQERFESESKRYRREQKRIEQRRRRQEWQDDQTFDWD